MLTQEELEERAQYIGASEAAAVLGMSRWDTPIGVWARKTGQLPVDDKSDDIAVYLGNELEEVVARIFTKKTGKKVHRVTEAFTHPNYKFLRCHIDRKVDGESAILQCKTASAWKAKEWRGEEVPDEYVIQELHELACTGYDRAYIAVLVGNQDFHLKVVERDPKLIAEIIRKEVNFWSQFVVTKSLPHTVTKNDADVLYDLFPHGDETDTITLSDQANILVESLQALESDAKLLEGQIEKQKNELKLLLQDNAVGVTDKYKVTWKDQSTVRLESGRIKVEKPEIYKAYSKTTKTRVLRYSELKGD